ncbi:MAG: DNA recombination protein RmuC [Flavobacteriales bacterium]|nr:DNA recombination protein RmuC [Flavobacteriales bacterium]
MEFIQEQPLLFALIIGFLSSLMSILLCQFFWRQKQSNWTYERSLLTEDLMALKETSSLYQEEQLAHTRLQSEYEHLEERLTSQKKELTDLHRQLYDQFENMANRILDRKSEKFSELNEKQIRLLIEPLGKDIETFRYKVEQEAKERFSLGEKVKQLAELNSHMSEVAINLTKALKGESKTQGNWGEMILESLLEKSGLIKGEQYILEHQLKDKEGKSMRSESENKKMRPDAIIMYPDDRNVIVDSKVSLTAFSRTINAENDEEYRLAIAEHLRSIKTHIKALSLKAYDDYDRSLDFVLMFIPSEPAYISAMKADPELWNYAYSKRILLQSPTNLITSLKLIEELWKREAHNQNAQAIALRGSKLYDKFVGFVESLEDMGAHLDKAKEKYDEGFKKLKTGRGNLVDQATKLRSMVGKTKKELPPSVRDDVIN